MDHETHEQIARLEEGQKHIRELLENHVASLTQRMDASDARFWWILGLIVAAAIGAWFR